MPENRFPILSAPSMVYGMDLVENVKKLSHIVDHVEIILYHTQDRHNIPTPKELALLEKVQGETGLTYSVHLPASLEIAAADANTRNASLERTIHMIHHFHSLIPEYFILHIPFIAPTLVAEPGCYFTEKDSGSLHNWSKRAIDGLKKIQGETGIHQRLLIENINYSPIFLEPFWRQGLCGFCLDIGHLLLGGECVRDHLERYLPVISEIHLHGVAGWEEHIGLEVIAEDRLRSWITRLQSSGYSGILNLEVFDPVHLASSLRLLRENGLLSI
jgi:sugar phosphate isomerase/epimerase